MLHHAVGDDGEHEAERHHQRHGARAVEVVAAELLEVAEEHEHHQRGIEQLSHGKRHALGCALLPLLLVALERLQDIVGVVIYNLSAVHYLLPRLHLTHVGHQHVIHLLPLLLRLGGVVSQVGSYVSRQFALAQLAVVVARAVLFCHHVFIGGLLCEDLFEGLRAGLVLPEEAHHSRILLLQTVVPFGLHHAPHIHLCQLLLQVRQVVLGHCALHVLYEIGSQRRQHCVHHGRVALEVGFVIAVQAVTLALQHLIGLEYREAVHGYEGAVVPRFALLVGQFVDGVPWHHAGQDKYCGQQYSRPQEYLLRGQFASMVESAHVSICSCGSAQPPPNVVQKYKKTSAN